MKKCTGCHQEKDESEFSKNRTRKDGRNHRCKPCENKIIYNPNSKCEVCGKGFYSTPSVKNKGLGRFCSIPCSAKSRDKKVTKNCEICGKKFTCHKYEIDIGKGRFCSVSCEGRWRKGSNSPRWEGGGIDIICIECGKVFRILKYQFGKTQYCSKTCNGKGKSKEKHPGWRGGFNRKDYPSEWCEKFRNEIRFRDNYTCAICRKYGKEVHHINYCKKETTTKNCITLCTSCHNKTNFNRDYWQEYLEAIVSDFSQDRK